MFSVLSFLSFFFILQILPDFYYTVGNTEDNDITTVVEKIYTTYISNTSRCVGAEVRVDSVNCLCSSNAYYGHPCDPETKQFDTSQCVFSRCKVCKNY
jgi:hypothetical protein